MMKLLSVSSFYRLASTEGAKKEDGIFVNAHANIYGVTDGNSAAFSPKNPPLLYGGLTGAQMVNSVVSMGLSFFSWEKDLEQFLLNCNQEILRKHKDNGKDPTKGDDVGGACFSFCQPSQEGLTFIFGGDSFIFVETKKGPLFLTGFDKAAFAIEKMDQDRFTECKAQAGGKIGAAWDLYWPIYRDKRIFCKNRNIGKGGDASLNGDPELEQCWKKVIIPWDDEPKMVLLGTDGLLPPSEVNPEDLDSLAKLLCQLYRINGITEILSWRDHREMKNKCLTHIDGWPEAAAVELKFG